MAMVGRGSGNFYAPLLVALGLAIHQAATTGQFILIASAVASAIVYQKHRTLDWKLVLLIEPPTDIGAFIGRYYAHLFRGTTLKFVFSGLLVLASFFMLHPVKEKDDEVKRGRGYWHRRFGEHEYTVPLSLAISITFTTGLVTGMV